MSINKTAVRTAFTDELLKLATADPMLWAVCTDSRGSVTLGDFAAKLPEQFVECGIAEQNAVSLASGLSIAGVRPFVCGPASFLAMRSAEQVKVDVAYAHRNVKIIGVSGGVSYGALGSTHHAVQDIALMRAIPGLEVYLPSDGEQMRQLTRYLAVSNNPAYVRMGRGAVPELYAGGQQVFTPGKAMRIYGVENAEAAVLACGECVYPALEAAKLLHTGGIEVRVYDMCSISPLDSSAVLEAAGTGLVVTVEEHSIHGGLGGAVAEVLAQERPTRMRILGLPNEELYTGSSGEVFEHYGLTAQGIATAIKSAI